MIISKVDLKLLPRTTITGYCVRLRYKYPWDEEAGWLSWQMKTPLSVSYTLDEGSITSMLNMS